MIRRRIGAAAALALGVLALAGCSQIAAIAPVGGARLGDVRYAAIDVLQSKGIEIMTAPVCAETDNAVACTGSTRDGAPIEVESPAADRTTFTLKVGGSTLYSGSVQAVLDAAVEGAG
ncbi:hypothetical protein ABCS02_23005 [Microbacterium sp. X-17]|uniref:hypothetical protein n=1 Tax=Microbacterium sp. X-17 TaxID=3144404 RepID=UPI0031F56BB4